MVTQFNDVLMQKRVLTAGADDAGSAAHGYVRRAGEDRRRVCFRLCAPPGRPARLSAMTAARCRLPGRSRDLESNGMTGAFIGPSGGAVQRNDFRRN